MSAPSSHTSPASFALGTSSCIRLRIRRNVDLPQPDGPMSAVIWPGGMRSDTRSSTLRSPNQADSDRASNSANGPAGSVGTYTGGIGADGGAMVITAPGAGSGGNPGGGVISGGRTISTGDV